MGTRTYAVRVGALIGATLLIVPAASSGASRPAGWETTPPVAPPRALFGTQGEELAPGTYFVDEADGHPTAPILITIGAGWINSVDGWAIGKGEVGFMTFSRPDAVFLDACHWEDGYHPGPPTTLDGLVDALREQEGWVDVTTVSDITVDGRAGAAFQRTAPTTFDGCAAGFAPFRSWENVDENGSKGWSYYEEGEIETLWVLDVDGTAVIVNTRLAPDQPAAVQDEFPAVLASLRIDADPSGSGDTAVEQPVCGERIRDPGPC